MLTRRELLAAVSGVVVGMLTPLESVLPGGETGSQAEAVQRVIPPMFTPRYYTVSVPISADELLVTDREAGAGLARAMESMRADMDRALFCALGVRERL